MPQTDSPPITPGSSWRNRATHRDWLYRRAEELFELFGRRSILASGGFGEIDRAGAPMAADNPTRQIHNTTRLVHCFAIGSLLGRPGSDEIVDHGMQYLWQHHRDTGSGGYFWSVNDAGPVDASKQAYGHAFVLLAAASASLVGHPLAQLLLDDVSEILSARFWEPARGAFSEEFGRDWSVISTYRGQNSNMHATEALMAAFEATGEQSYLAKARSIAELIIGRLARSHDYRVAEHFDSQWQLDKDYRNGDIFRPFGTTPGHWLEWSRLLLQLYALDDSKSGWLVGAARTLFQRATALGWDRTHGGFYYTLDWNDAPMLAEKLWWPHCEAIGAATFLMEHDPDPAHEIWYRRLWDFADRHFLDHEHGGWHPELSEDLRVSSRFFSGKPDLYHALQATLIPLYPAIGSVTRAIMGQQSA